MTRSAEQRMPTTLLRELGASADAIAARLGRMGYRGRRSSSRRCPLARWLADQGYEGAAVTELFVRWDLGFDQPVPCVAADFMRRFDQGYYPELEAD